jgi:hypothetical protein
MRTAPPLRLTIRATLAALLCVAWAGATAAAQPPTVKPLLPLARGGLLLSLGQPPAWQPVTGQPLTVTLFSGRPAVTPTTGLNAYIGLQSVVSACPASPRTEHGRLLTIDNYYQSADLLAPTSLFAPGGGAQAGDYQAAIPNIALAGGDQLRACLWIGRNRRLRPHRRGHGKKRHEPLPPGRIVPGKMVDGPITQDIPLLDGLFAASVSDVPSAGAAQRATYTLDAAAVTRSFSYTVRTSQCGKTTAAPALQVAAGTLASEVVAVPGATCRGDGSQFAFTVAGASLGSIAYGPAQAEASPPTVIALGGCELDPVVGASVTAASRYVESDGCTVGNLLAAPFQAGLPRGAVIEAQVDGGVAELAPNGTRVDLVLNGG